MLPIVKQVVRIVLGYDPEIALRRALEIGKLIERGKHKDSYEGSPRCPVCDTMLRRIVTNGHALYLCPFESFHITEPVTPPVLPTWSERDRVTGPVQMKRPLLAYLEEHRRNPGINTQEFRAIHLQKARQG